MSAPANQRFQLYTFKLSLPGIYLTFLSRVRHGDDLNLQSLGALSIRGYVYQQRYPLLGINLLPNLTTFDTLPSAFNIDPLNAQARLTSPIPSFTVYMTAQ